MYSIEGWPLVLAPCSLMGGLYTATAFPSDSERTEGMQNDYFSAFSPQYFSDDFPALVRAFLVGPLSPTDFSDGIPMD
jgi:hypothetical protein